MLACKVARSASVLEKCAEQHASCRTYAAAAAVCLRTAETEEQSQLSAAHERRLQEMYRATGEAQPMIRQGAERKTYLPSAAEVADRLSSSKGASCSGAIATTENNAGIDWREAVAVLQAQDRQRLQHNMLTDTFRWDVPVKLTAPQACTNLKPQALLFETYSIDHTC